MVFLDTMENAPGERVTFIPGGVTDNDAEDNGDGEQDEERTGDETTPLPPRRRTLAYGIQQEQMMRSILAGKK